MINIPTNENKRDYVAETAERMLKALNNSKWGEVDFYRSELPSLEIGKAAAREFVKKGYYAKVVYFADGRASFQRIVVSKNPLKESVARMVYSEML